MNILDKAVLKNLEHHDLQQVLNWRNKKYIRQMMYSSELISMESHLKWFEAIGKETKTIVKVFYYKEKAYGIVQFNNIDMTHGTCEWSFYIGDDSAPKGMGTLMGITALNYIFMECNIRKVNAEVLDFNRRSMVFHENLGFQQEGCLKRQIVKNNRFMDVYLFGLLNSEWENIASEKTNKFKKIFKGDIQ